MLRIGQGFDVHAFADGRRLVLCGVEFPGERGLDGHSDADVALHAVIDALLGALALGDIGKFFPDDDPEYLGADSMELCRRVVAKIGKFTLHNLDLTIVAQAPRLMPHREDMRHNLASALNCPVDRVSVKATTTEHLGFTGRREGIAAVATVLLDAE